ncbi:MAG: hypothetical protein ACOC0N_00515 [Chroococcales cyanobacterium]
MNLPIIYHPEFVAPLPPGHRFPMAKFQLLYEMLLAEGIAEFTQIQPPQYPPKEWLELVHTSDYVTARRVGIVARNLESGLIHFLRQCPPFHIGSKILFAGVVGLSNVKEYSTFEDLGSQAHPTTF